MKGKCRLDRRPSPLPLFFLVSLLPLVSGCLILDGSFREREIDSFCLRPIPNNPSLMGTYYAEIDSHAGEIRIRLPDNIGETSLAPEFSFRGIMVLVGGIEQESGVSRQDFTKPLTYSVLGLDDEATEYRVVASFTPPLGTKGFEPLEISIKYFNGCPWYFSQTMNGLNHNIGDYPEAELSNVTLTFKTDGVKVVDGDGVDIPLYLQYPGYYGGATLRSSATLDFSQPVEFRVTAEDGSTAAYTVRITNDPSIYYFSFQSDENPALPDTIDGSIDHFAGLIDIEIPADSDLSSLIATVNYYGFSLNVAGMPQTSGSTVNDFTSEVVYTVRGRNGNDKAFRVRVHTPADGPDA